MRFFLFCFDLCHFLERAPIVFCFFSLAVEPFNTQPQLHYITLSRSYKGSFSAWCLVLAWPISFSMVLQHALSCHSIFLLITLKSAVYCLKATGVLNSLLTTETFPTTLSSLGRNLLEKFGCENGRLPSPQSKVEKTCMALCKHAVSCCFLGLSLYSSGCKISCCISIFFMELSFQRQVVTTVAFA